jgi:hypothetical protein
MVLGGDKMEVNQPFGSIKINQKQGYQGVLHSIGELRVLIVTGKGMDTLAFPLET